MTTPNEKVGWQNGPAMFLNNEQNNSVPNQPTPNVNEESINNLAAFLAPVVPSISPNTINSIGRVKEELVEDLNKELDDIKYSSFMPPACGCTPIGVDCVKPCNGDCNCIDNKCCYGNAECWKHYCKPRSKNADGCCNDEDLSSNNCHQSTPDACCKCRQFCKSPDPTSPSVYYYPIENKIDSWPDLGKILCFKNGTSLTVAKYFDFTGNTGSPEDAGCEEPYTAQVSDTPLGYRIGLDTFPDENGDYIAPTTCGEMFGPDSRLYTIEGFTDYGCLEQPSEDECKNITDRTEKRLCFAKRSKPVNIKPDSDCYFCVLNMCTENCEGRGLNKPCDDVTNDFTCSCAQTIAYLDEDGEPVYCNQLTFEETLTNEYCMFWVDWEQGCYISCDPSCSPTTCSDYSDCVARTGRYATGLPCNPEENGCSCGTSPCLQADGTTKTECLSNTKQEYLNCRVSCPCKDLCCTDWCSLNSNCQSDYWTCTSDPDCNARGCCSKNCLRDCGSNPCSSANPNCRKGFDQDGCCACADSRCATSTKAQYDNCIDPLNSSTQICRDSGCCQNPCTRTPPTDLASYTACKNGTGIYAGYDPACCGSFNCNWCGANPIAVCANTDQFCSLNNCCQCNTPACATTTKSQYDNCTKPIAQGGCPTPGCCVNPCTRTPPTDLASYTACKNGTGIYAGYDPDCCGSFNCNWCGANPIAVCANASQYCTSCCTCNTPACATTTKAEYINCTKPVAQGGCPTPGCCVNPCATIPTPTNGTTYNQCITRTGAYSGFGNFDTACCGNWNCTWCGLDPVSVCANTTFSQCTSCCVCDDTPVCQPSDTSIGFTKTEWLQCISSCPNIGCCQTDPCDGAPSNYWDCKNPENTNSDGIPWITLGCCNFNCSACTQPTDRDGDGTPDSSYCDCARRFPPQCGLPQECSTNNCCVCSTSQCATTTKAEYENCIAAGTGCPESSCCDNPCIISGIPVTSLITNTQLYDQCIAKTGIFSGLRDNACCGSFLCSYCGSTPCSSTDTRCKDSSNPSGDCCNCNDAICSTITIENYLSCLSNPLCNAQSCCNNPCKTTLGTTAQQEINSIATYDACLAKTGIFSTVTDIKCCGNFQCSYCGSTPCSSSDTRCKNTSSPLTDCCNCNDPVCSTTTIQNYLSCLSNPSCTNQQCCNDPCKTTLGTSAQSEINSIATYDACLAKTGIFSTVTDTACCGSFQCSYCGSTPCSSTDTRCKDSSNPSGDCCECNNSECATSTKSDYENCLIQNTIGKCLACCSNPCAGMPAITTVEEWRACKAAESGTVNVYKPYTDKGCSCGEFVCTLCKPSSCANPDPLCQATTCCVCNKTACKTSTKLEYDSCRLNTECKNAGCCINPCIGKPKDYNTCIRSPYAAKGCCDSPPPGPCDLCNYCRGNGGICMTDEEYNQCISSPTCSTNNCCIRGTINPCESCPGTCNECKANSTCVDNGCCSHFTCTNMNCPDSNTITSWKACKNNQCCNDLGCCIYPCTNCPKDYATCIQNSFCANAGCCPSNPDPCTTCDYENSEDCYNDLNCASNGCCPPNPCEGCLDADPNSYYTCIENPSCMLNGCCGLAPCILNNCRSSTKTEYEQCLANPDCVPPQQSVDHPCCTNPCEGCSTNYFECNRNPACVAAGCCPSAPSCLDCKTDPAHPNASCTHPDPRCSNAPDAVGVAGCCNCKSSRCQDDTRNEYITCINKQNKSFCMDTWGTGQPCCTNPCSNCPPYKESSYPACITTPGCADKGCCLAPPPDPCYGCRNSSCSDIAECTRNACCRETPPCELCDSDYYTCITQPTCVSKGCCPPHPCTPCNKSRTKEGYAECSSSEVCVANNCCNDPCDVCYNYYYKECVSDIYCSANDCCPPEPCTVCSDNYEECIANPVCRLYCCCKE